MLIEIVRSIILLYAGFGFYSSMMLIERLYGKKTSLIVTLTLGGLTVLGLILHPF